MDEVVVTELTHARLLEVLHYDPATGVFTWREPVSRKTRVGGVAGGLTADKTTITLFKKKYAAHRLAWFYFYQKWPDTQIDHIDADPHNNQINNLRLANKSTNGMNRGPQRNNTTGFKGVCRHGRGGFTAQITKDGKSKYLGYFKTPEEAHAAYAAASELYHGTFGRLT